MLKRFLFVSFPVIAGLAFIISHGAMAAKIGSGANPSVAYPQVQKVNMYKPQGTLDLAQCTSFSGWAWDPDFPNRPVMIKLLDGGRSGTVKGKLIATKRADLYRTDLDGVKGNGKHGFSFKISTKASKGKHDYHLEVMDLNDKLWHLVDVKSAYCNVKIGSVSATKNQSMVDAGLSSPTGAKGAAGVKIASFVLIAGPNENIKINKITLSSPYGLGSDFQNLKLFSGAAQIGQTIGMLSSVASSTYAFALTTPVTIGANQQYVVDVRADISTNAINAGVAPYSAITLGLINAKGATSLLPIAGNFHIPGQLVYIADKGSLVATPDVGAPDNQNHYMDSTARIPLGVFKLTAGLAEDVVITKIALTDSVSGIAATTTAVNSIINLKLIKSSDGSQYGQTVAVLSKLNNNSADAIVVFNGSLIIKQGQSEVFYLSGVVNDYPNAISGSGHQFKIASGSDIVAVGVMSGRIINTDNSLVIGGTQSVYRSKLRGANGMMNVTGGANSQQQIGRYDLTNMTSGNYSITVSDIDLGIKSTINNNATTSVKLYRNYLGGAPIAEKIFVGGADFSSINNWDSFTPFTIDAVGGNFGFTSIYITADTWNAALANMISTSIDAATWSDGISQSNYIDYAPISGATIMY